MPEPASVSQRQQLQSQSAPKASAVSFRNSREKMARNRQFGADAMCRQYDNSRACDWVSDDLLLALLRSVKL